MFADMEPLPIRSEAKRLDLGSAAKAVAQNVRRIRGERGLSIRAVAARTSEIGHPLPHSALSKIENEQRRVDIEDLLALAIALETSPASLLLAYEPDPERSVAIIGTVTAPSRAAWEWAQGTEPLPAPTSTYEEALSRWSRFISVALPWWQARDAMDSARHDSQDA
jgi:transcriptional regulator with XRE-family HTH domain